MEETIIDNKPYVLVPKEVWEDLRVFFNAKDSAGE